MERFDEMNGAFLEAAIRLHGYILANHWDGCTIGGSDQGVRWNLRIGRFVKSYMPVFGRGERYVFQQGQGYWAASNWLLHDITGDSVFRQIAFDTTRGTAEAQLPDGSWQYPLRERRHLKATVEGNWGAITLLYGHERMMNSHWLEGAIRWHRFLLEKIGFQPHGAGRAVNYFDRPRGKVPNNSVSLIWVLGEYHRIIGAAASQECTPFLDPVPDLLSFLEEVQLPTGEYPYELPGPFESRTRTHYLCFQYNAFQCMRLLWYAHATGERRAFRMAESLAKFLAQGVLPSGAAMAACGREKPEVVYYSAALGMALYLAHRHGIGDYLELAMRCFNWVMKQQREDGGMFFSKADYGFLADRGSYPRYLAMTLYHLLRVHSYERERQGHRG